MPLPLLVDSVIMGSGVALCWAHGHRHQLSPSLPFYISSASIPPGIAYLADAEPSAVMIAAAAISLVVALMAMMKLVLVLVVCADGSGGSCSDDAVAAAVAVEWRRRSRRSSRSRRTHEMMRVV